MWKSIKLLINCLASAVIFNYFILILILLINPHISASTQEFFLLYANLFLFYGSIWIFFIGVSFFIVQFFSEKKYPIGILTPPTLTYFLSFTILLVTIVLYFNYDYYFQFLSLEVRAKFIKVLFINLALIITGILFVTIKKRDKRWLQIFFLVLLSYNIITSYAAIIFSSSTEPVIPVHEKQFPEDTTPRKIRIVIMDGLSSNFILSLSSEEKLLNFKHLLNNGVRGRIATFEPNLDLSLLSATFSGLKPSKFTWHSYYRFKISTINHEFNIFPRYIFFRNSSYFNITTFYKKKNAEIPDYLSRYYQENNFKTLQLMDPYYTPVYSELSLQYNPRFIPLFSDILKKNDRKYEIVKKAFFFDDYIKNRIPELKDNDLYCSIIKLKGLGTVSKYFYQYSRSQTFENIPEAEIKQYGWIIEKYYEYYDSIIGNLISTTGDDELLVVMSLFEYEPLPYWRRILVNLLGDRDLYVYNPINSRGTIFMYEKNALKKDYPMKMISIFDIFPTLLYYAGFQLSKDLQGEVIREIFNEDFLLNNPVDIITGSR